MVNIHTLKSTRLAPTRLATMMASAAVPSHATQERSDPTRQTSSNDRQSHPPARRHGPTTPLRRVSRGSFSKDRQSSNESFPLDSLEPAFAELSDAMTDLNANFEQLQEMHNSLARFSESFASFLYGLNMNAFCNEFPQAPTLQSFKRAEGHFLLILAYNRRETEDITSGTVSSKQKFDS